MLSTSKTQGPGGGPGVARLSRYKSVGPDTRSPYPILPQSMEPYVGRYTTRCTPQHYPAHDRDTPSYIHDQERKVEYIGAKVVSDDVDFESSTRPR